MRATSLALIAFVLAAFLAGLWFFVGDDPAVVRAGSNASAHDRSVAGAANTVNGDASNTQDPHAERETRVVIADANASGPQAGAAEETPPHPPRVLGRVVTSDGTPVANARVWATKGAEWYAPIPLDIEPEAVPRGWMKVHDTVTAADGTFQFEELDKGGVRLAARASGFAPRYEDKWTLKGDNEEHLPDLVLTPGVFLAGKVVDRGGKPVVGATVLAAIDRLTVGKDVSVPGRGVPLATTDVEGHFAVDELAAGPWHFILDAPGYLVHEEEGRTEHVGEHVADLVFVLEPGLDIVGRVRGFESALAGVGEETPETAEKTGASAASSAPAAASSEVGESLAPAPRTLRISARLVPEPAHGNSGSDEGDDGALNDATSVRVRHALCDAEGNFVLRGLKTLGDYRLSASLSTSEIGRWKRAPGVDSVTAMAGQRGVELVWKPESAVICRVVDAATKTPLTDLSVWIGVGRERPLRDEKNELQKEFKDGRVRCGELRPQSGKSIVLVVRAPGFKEYENRTISLSQGQTLDLGEIALERQRTLSVRVLDAATEKPVADARVVVSLEDGDNVRGWLGRDTERELGGDQRAWGAHTDAGGTAHLAGAPGKPLWVGATADGYLACEPVRTLHPVDADHSLELRLTRGGSVQVRVTDPTGRPVKGVGIAHRTPEEANDEGQDWMAITAEKRTDAGGLAEFENLPLGVHSFCVHDEAGEIWINNDDPNSQRPTWVERSITEGGRIELAFTAEPRGTIFGRVSEGGVALEGAQLRLSRVREGETGEVGWGGPQDPMSTTTDHDGRYRYEDLRCGEYWLSVHHSTRRMGTRVRVSVVPEPKSFDVELDMAAIEGEVTDIEGHPIPGVEVVVGSSDGSDEDDVPYQMVVREDERGNTRMDYRPGTKSSERTDSRGHYVLRGLATGIPLRVHVQSDLLEPGSSDEIQLAPNEVKTGVDFHLRRAGSIQIALTGTIARQNTWYEVRALRVENGEESFAQSTWIGSWNRNATLRGLPPGHYKVSMGMPQRGEGQSNDTRPTQEIDVRAQETTQVSFQAF